MQCFHNIFSHVFLHLFSCWKPGFFKQIQRISRRSTKFISTYNSHILHFINITHIDFAKHHMYTKILDRCQERLFGKCIAFQILGYVEWVFQGCTYSAPRKMQEKHGKTRSLMFFIPQPSAQLRWLENLTTSQHLRLPCQWRIIPVALR